LDAQLFRRNENQHRATRLDYAVNRQLAGVYS
jgi:hypothetical protein